MEISVEQWSGEQALAVVQRWKSSPRLRQEFCENFDSYCAFVRAVVGGGVRATLPFELAGVFDGVAVDDPPERS